jgi:hypothetical protein
VRLSERIETPSAHYRIGFELFDHIPLAQVFFSDTPDRRVYSPLMKIKAEQTEAAPFYAHRLDLLTLDILARTLRQNSGKLKKPDDPMEYVGRDKCRNPRGAFG